MSEIDSEEERMLAGARRAWSATSEDAERVLRATQLSILGLPAAAAGTSSKAAALRSGAGKLVVSKWLAGTLVAVLVAGSGGYLLGYRAGERASRSLVAAPAIVRPPELLPTTVPSPSVDPPAAASAAQPSAAAEPAPTAGPAPHQDRAPSLLAETRALKKIERALRDGKPELALRLLASLERTSKDGPLAEERLAASALAHCAQSPDPERSREFCARYPGSVYRSRVEQACVAALGGREKLAP